MEHLHLHEGFVLLDEENYTHQVLYENCEDAAEDMIRGDVIHEGIALYSYDLGLLGVQSAKMAELN